MTLTINKTIPITIGTKGKMKKRKWKYQNIDIVNRKRNKGQLNKVR